MALFHDNSTMRILNSLCDVSLDEFDDRLRLQKIAFLAQKLGSTGNFTFAWYVRGPYSPSLTQALFQCDQAGELGKKPDLRSEEKQVIDKITELVGESGIDDSRTLELYASVWYLLPVSKAKSRNFDSVYRVMESDKPDYTKSEVKEAIEKILMFREKNSP